MSQEATVSTENPSSSSKLPFVYSPKYNIAFLGLEKLHPFDSGKWGRIYLMLKEAGVIKDDSIYEPKEATDDMLLQVHSRSYLNKLKWSAYVAQITEVPFVALLPNFLVQRKVLKPFRYQTSGTVLAARLALQHGWAINIGGGFHHCSAESGGGFCAYADITLAIKILRQENLIKNAMIVDLDAHQGNGHERDFLSDPDVYILDVYNRGIYPGDEPAKKAITRKVELPSGMGDADYLRIVNENLRIALKQFHPDMIMYNAGTDILEGDMLGRLNISESGIISRDELVFETAKELKIPVVMVTSGGYQRRTARVIAQSIINLHRNDILPRRNSRENISSLKE